MIRLKRFSKILNVRGVDGRKLDQNMGRLGELRTQAQMIGTELNREMRKLNRELNLGRMGKWHDTD